MYLDAWTHVKTLAAKSKEEGPTSDAIRTLLDNWTNEEFVKWVDDLTDLINSYVYRLLSPQTHLNPCFRSRLDVKPGTQAWARAEQVWARVLELEASFWPVESDIALLKK